MEFVNFCLSTTSRATTSTIVRGSALKALEGDAEWEAKSRNWLAFWLHIPEPERAIDKPFLLPIEDVFSISGRGTLLQSCNETRYHQSW